MRRVELEPLEELGAAGRVDAAAQPAEQVDHLAAGQVRPQRDVAGDVGEPAVQRGDVAPGVAAEEPAVPASARSSPSRIRMVVVLPAPFGPEEAVHLAGADGRGRGRRGRRVRPKLLTRPMTSMASAMVGTYARFTNCERSERHDEGAFRPWPIRRRSALARFVEDFASVTIESGVPRMPARVFACLMVAAGGRLTAAELAERLQASPAAISGAVRYLIQVHLVTRTREPGSRRDLYVVEHEVLYRAMLGRDVLLQQLDRPGRRGHRRARSGRRAGGPVTGDARVPAVPDEGDGRHGRTVGAAPARTLDLDPGRSGRPVG